MTKRLTQLKRLGFSFGSVLLLFLMLEILARFFGPAPEWKVGLPSKLRGTKRILVFGGSTVFGTPVPELAFVSQLEAGLRHLSPNARVEVINLGRPGASSDYVLRAIRSGITFQPDLIILKTGHNEFLSRLGERSWPERITRWGCQNSSFYRFLTQKMNDARRASGPAAANRLRGPVDRESAWFKTKTARYRKNVKAIVREAQSHRVPLLLLTSACNLSDWPPAHGPGCAPPGSGPDYHKTVTRVEQWLGEGRVEDAAKQIDGLLKPFPDDAMALYLKGRVAAQRGQADEARDLFIRAKDLDPIPWRALTEFNDAVQSFDGQPCVHVVDLEKMFAEKSPKGLVGFNFFGDNCHPVPLGHAEIACELIRSIGQCTDILPQGLSLGEPQAWFELFLQGLEPGLRKELVEVLWPKRTALLCMIGPFYRYDVARGYLAKAMEVAPGDWTLWANMGCLSALEGRAEEALDELRRGASLKGGTISLNDIKAVPYLKEAFAKLGLRRLPWSGNRKHD